MGSTQLDMGGTVILTVSFPCAGTLADGTNFTTNTCDNDNVISWQVYAEQQAAKMGYPRLDRFQHRVIILPPNFHRVMASEWGPLKHCPRSASPSLVLSGLPKALILPFPPAPADCSFDALASQGLWDYVNDPSRRNTWGYGLVWICGDCWDFPPTYFHELGHNVSSLPSCSS
jgi:hypothetical protein